MTPAPDHRPTSIISAEISAMILKLATLNEELTRSMEIDERHQSRRQKRRWRQKRYRERIKKKRNEMTKTAQNGKTNRLSVTREEWRGITFHDMPGKNPDAQKMNLSLLRLRDIPRLRSCYDLHGDALKTELARIKGINRDKSLRAMEPKGSAPPG